MASASKTCPSSREVYCLLVALFAPTIVRGQPVSIGPEFQANTYTSGSQQFPALATDAEGNFIVVWESTGQDGSGLGIFGRRFDSDGDPLGGEFQVNTGTVSDQRSPSVAMDSTGGFVVVWEAQTRVLGQRFDGDGVPLGTEFQVNTYTGATQAFPAIAMNASGDFIVVWESFLQDGSSRGVFGRLFDSGGNPLGGGFQVNTYTSNDQYNPAVAMDASGNFIAVWQSTGQDGSLKGVFGQRFDSSGNALGGEFQVNTYTNNDQYNPAVAMDASGDFVVVWNSLLQDGSSTGVFGQQFDSSGNALGGEFQVNTYTTSGQRFPAAAADPSGNFVVVWQSFGQDAYNAPGVFGQHFDSNGIPLDGEFQVNTYTTGSQFVPAVAVADSGDFVVVWDSFGQDGSDSGVFGQRFCAMEADGDGICDGEDNCPADYNPAQEDADGDGSGDACDSCTDADQDGVCAGADNCGALYNPAQDDPDADGVGTACDNCAAVYNPGQENSDGKGDGGDACDMSIYTPQNGTGLCGGTPPTLRWSTESYDRFRVFVSWDPNFAKAKRYTSGDRLLKVPFWTPPVKKWNRGCTNANPNLYIKVFGKIAGTTTKEFSDVVALIVR